VGYHDGRGYSAIITKEKVDKMLSELDKVDPDPSPLVEDVSIPDMKLQCGMYEFCNVKCEDTDEFTLNSHMLPEHERAAFGSFNPVCVINDPVASPPLSKLVKTSIGKRQVFGPTDLVPMKLNTHMKDGTAVFPMVEALKPYATPVRYVDSWWLTPAVRTAMKPFFESTTNVSGRVLTYEEAVKGNPAIGLKSIPRNTSVGYPYCKVAADKSFFWGNADEYNLNLPNAKILEKHVMELLAMIKAGKRPFFTARGFLKDETRRLGKSARYIAGTNVAYYILCRMYFGAIVAAQMVQHKENGMCPGIKEFAEWPWLKDWITRPSGGEGDPRVWDGDFKGFDTEQLAKVLFEILDAINEWYTIRGGAEEDNKVRYILFMDLAFSRHLVGRGSQSDMIVQWQKSLPSGHFLTALVNSVYSMTCMVAPYVYTFGTLDYWENCAAATLGDDNVNGASEKVTDHYNQVVVAEFLNDQLGLTYTPADKTSDFTPYTSIDKITFLKRRFHIVNGHLTCPLELKSILHSMYWVRESKHMRSEEIVKVMLENALGELSLHGREIWDEWSPKVFEEMRVLGATPLLGMRFDKYLSYMLQRRDSSWAGLQIRVGHGVNTGDEI
jgi:hypothetical protein